MSQIRSNVIIVLLCQVGELGDTLSPGEALPVMFLVLNKKIVIIIIQK